MKEQKTNESIKTRNLTDIISDFRKKEMEFYERVGYDYSKFFPRNYIIPDRHRKILEVIYACIIVGGCLLFLI